MPFYPFAMEQMMSEWENVVDYNLSESGVHPMTTLELVEDRAHLDRLWAMGLDYPQTNGTPELRERICALYRGSSPDNVLVTTGAAEANFIARREETAAMRSQANTAKILEANSTLMRIRELVCWRRSPATPSSAWSSARRASPIVS